MRNAFVLSLVGSASILALHAASGVAAGPLPPMGKVLATPAPAPAPSPSPSPKSQIAPKTYDHAVGGGSRDPSPTPTPTVAAPHH